MSGGQKQAARGGGGGGKGKKKRETAGEWVLLSRTYDIHADGLFQRVLRPARGATQKEVNPALSDVEATTLLLRYATLTHHESAGEISSTPASAARPPARSLALVPSALRRDEDGEDAARRWRAGTSGRTIWRVQKAQN